MEPKVGDDVLSLRQINLYTIVFKEIYYKYKSLVLPAQADFCPVSFRLLVPIRRARLPCANRPERDRTLQDPYRRIRA